ncbi:sulfite exporter TauE/SafE family protein [Pelomicrobium sp. G1]|uniref:sulfite exporter TauE/SafE family protein n=1 Tax=unclassified Pelomicrobium TaxID=2815318 RepID=UPI003F7741F1
MWFEYAILFVGGFAGAVVIGSAGFAFALVATAVWLQALPPARVVPLVTVCAIVLNGILVWRFRRAVKLGLLGRFLAGALPGVPLGVLALTHVDPEAIRALVGVVLMGYSGYLLARARPPVLSLPRRWAPLADASVGWIGGVMGGATGLNGVVPALWGQLRGFNKLEQRGVLQPFFFLVHLYTLTWLGGAGVLSRGLVEDLLLCLPAMLAGTLVGLRLFEYVSEAGFRRVVLTLFVVMGAMLLF